MARNQSDTALKSRMRRLLAGPLSFRAQRERCGTRTGTIIPGEGCTPEEVVSFLRKSDPGCLITLDGVDENGGEFCFLVNGAWPLGGE